MTNQSIQMDYSSLPVLIFSGRPLPTWLLALGILGLAVRLSPVFLTKEGFEPRLCESVYAASMTAGSCSPLPYLCPLLFPVPSRGRAVGDSPEGPRPAPMAEPDRESGASVGGSGLSGAWLRAAGPGGRGRA